MPVSASITGDMRVADIITLLPEAEEVMRQYGLHCAHCSVGGWETLQDGCAVHGFDDDETHALIQDLNDLLSCACAPQGSVTLTRSAAETIRGIMEAEGRLDQPLTVLPDGRGGFCLEFLESPLDPDAPIFRCPEVPEVRLTASPLVLRRVGGGAIDFRDKTLKFDLPELTPRHACCGGTGEGCGCAS